MASLPRPSQCQVLSRYSACPSSPARRHPPAPPTPTGCSSGYPGTPLPQRCGCRRNPVRLPLRYSRGSAAEPNCSAPKPEWLQLHRSWHARILAVMEPKPNRALAKCHATFGRYVPVNSTSPQWMHRRLYRIASVLNSENDYSFVMWEESGDDGRGYIFTDQEGRALGGCAVRWREWCDAPDCWALQWIWVAPPYRRLGILRDVWKMLTKTYRGIIPEPPYSIAMAQFLLSLDGVPDVVKRHARAASSHPLNRSSVV